MLPSTGSQVCGDRRWRPSWNPAPLPGTLIPTKGFLNRCICKDRTIWGRRMQPNTVIHGEWALALHTLIAATAAFALGRASIRQTAVVAFSLTVAFIASIGWGVLTPPTTIVWREMFDPRQGLCMGGIIGLAVQVIIVWGVPGLLAYLVVTLRRRFCPGGSRTSWAILGLALVCVTALLLLTVRFSGAPPF